MPDVPEAGDLGLNAQPSGSAATIERLRKHCFRQYFHGALTPWKCPECGQRWRVLNREWVPV